MNTAKLSNNELDDLISKASIAYGNAAPIITDAEFDALIDEKKRRNPDYIDTVTYDEGNMEAFTKMKHTMTTGTLSKCRNEEEFRAWFNKQPGDYIIETKQDGGGLELIYKDGKLIHAITRGNGFEGFDVINNASKFCPTELKSGYTGSIRGEYMLSKETFNRYFTHMANCRNAAAGLIKRLDGSENELLSFVAYDWLPSNNENLNSNELLSFLLENGFEVPDFIVANNVNDILNWREEISNKRDELPYDIDGIVVKPLCIDLDDNQNKTPKKSCAIKFELQEATSVVEDIIWQQRGSIVSPIACIKPIQLNGTKVSRVSLSNLSNMISKGIEVGSTVVVVKRGEIIPYIDRVI